MSKQHLFSLFKKEVARIDAIPTSKRNEKIIDGFTNDVCPQALIHGKSYRVFNSNDYLGLRFHPATRKGEQEASEIYGTGPGSVRFISGTMRVYKDLEKELATFHERDDAMVFSSAFATNVAVIHCLLKGQSKDSLISDDVVVISDALNHRSIIEGIRVANLPKEQRAVYNHLDYQHLKEILETNKDTYKRAVVITDGIFSMLGEAADLGQLRAIVDIYDGMYEEGVLLVVDDSHGVGAYGATGRGCEEMTNGKADVLIGTLGKAFGADGGYVVANREVIDYLRESAATYIYSNTISPGVAGAALASVRLMQTEEGQKLLTTLQENITAFQEQMKQAGFLFAAESNHAIQPILIGNPEKTKLLTEKLFEQGILVTNLSYPVVSPGRDEIRVQISAAHTKEDITYFIETITKVGKMLQLVS